MGGEEKVLGGLFCWFCLVGILKIFLSICPDFIHFQKGEKRLGLPGERMPARSLPFSCRPVNLEFLIVKVSHKAIA